MCNWMHSKLVFTVSWCLAGSCRIKHFDPACCDAQETIDQMASQVRKKALEAGQLESQVHSLRGAASESEELRLRVRLLAEHNCRLVGAWKGLLADHGVDVGAVRQPSLGDVLAQGKEATEMALSVQLLGLEQCRAVLQQARTAAGEGQKERMALQERAGALSAELEGSKTREAAAAQRSAQLEQQLQHMRQSRGASEHAIRRAAEEEVMQGQVTTVPQHSFHEHAAISMQCTALFCTQVELEHHENATAICVLTFVR